MRGLLVGGREVSVAFFACIIVWSSVLLQVSEFGGSLPRFR